MHRDILKKSAVCQPCTDMGNNTKSLITSSHWNPNVDSSEPVYKIHSNFGVLLLNRKTKKNMLGTF